MNSILRILLILFLSNGTSPLVAQSDKSQVVLYPKHVSTIVDSLKAGAGHLSIAPDGSLWMPNLRETWSGRGLEGTTLLQIWPNGNRYTKEVNLRGPSSCIFDSEGNLFVASFRDGTVTKFNNNHEPMAVVPTHAGSPAGITFGPNGDLFVCSCWGNSIIRIGRNRTVRLMSRDKLFNNPWGIVAGSSGELFVSNSSDGKVIRVTADGSASEFCKIPGHGNGDLAIYDDCLYVASRSENRIYRVDVSGEVSIFLGTGTRGDQSGDPKTATLSSPVGIAITKDGSTMYVSESTSQKDDLDLLAPSRIRKIDLRKERLAAPR